MRIDGFDIFMGCIFILVAVFMAVGFFVYLPTSLYTEAECLRNGYPKYSVSVGLERYCMTLDGAVTVRVDKAGTK